MGSLTVYEMKKLICLHIFDRLFIYLVLWDIGVYRHCRQFVNNIVTNKIVREVITCPHCELFNAYRFTCDNRSSNICG